MVTVEEASQQVTQARQQAEEQRQKLAEARQKAQEDAKRLREAESKLPKPSQQRLRSGLYSGLEGRKRRQIVGDIKKEISGRKGLLKEYETGLSEFEEKELKPFESQITQYEAEIKDYQAHQKAYNRIYKLSIEDPSKIGLLAIYGDGYVKSYAKEWVKLRDLQRQQDFKLMASTPSSNVPSPSTSLGSTTGSGKINWYKSFQKGAKDVAGIIQNPLILKERVENLFRPEPGVYWDLEKGIASEFPIDKGEAISPKNLPSLSLDIKPPRGLSRTDTLKDFNALKLSSVPSPQSFKLGRDVGGTWFLTTGSPKRFTPLSSIKPKRPATPSKPLMIRKPQIKSKKSVLDIKPKKKDKYEDLFFGKSKKGKGKKKSLWGF
jgi:hypothetical protein